MDSTASAQTATLELADIHSRGYLMVRAVECFGSLLETRSNRGYKVQDHLAFSGRERLRAASRHLHPQPVALASGPVPLERSPILSMSKRSP
jgi:hypothetical protein